MSNLFDVANQRASGSYLLLAAGIAVPRTVVPPVNQYPGCPLVAQNGSSADSYSNSEPTIVLRQDTLVHVLFPHHYMTAVCY